MKYLLSILLCCLLFCTCRHDDDKYAYETKRSAVYFAIRDTTVAYAKFLKAAAFLNNGEWANRDHILPIPIQLFGAKSEKDRKINVSFIPKFSSFQQNEIKLSQPIIRAGQSMDTLYVTLHNLPDGYSYYPYLTLGINETTELGVVRENSRLVVVYSEYPVPLTYLQYLEDYGFTDL